MIKKIIIFLIILLGCLLTEKGIFAQEYKITPIGTASSILATPLPTQLVLTATPAALATPQIKVEKVIPEISTLSGIPVKPVLASPQVIMLLKDKPAINLKVEAKISETKQLILENEPSSVSGKIVEIMDRQTEIQEQLKISLDKLEENKIKTIIFGPDYNNLNQLRSLVLKNKAYLDQLEGLNRQVDNPQVKAQIMDVFETMDLENQIINNEISQKENAFSLFGGLIKQLLILKSGLLTRNN